MSKIKNNIGNQPLEKRTPIELKIMNTVLPMNYEGLEYVSWFLADSKNVQEWATTIFRGNLNTSDPKLADLISAANKSIQETENDIALIKECLAKITPTT